MAHVLPPAAPSLDACKHALAPPPQSPRWLYHVPAITAAARSHLGYSRPGSSPQSPQRPDPTSPSPWHAPELPASPKIRPKSSIVDGACSLNLHHAPASASRPLRTSSRVADTAPPACVPAPVQSGGSQNEWCFMCEFEKLIVEGKRCKTALSPTGILSRLNDIGSSFGPETTGIVDYRNYDVKKYAVGLVYGLLISFNVNSKPFFAVEEQRQLLDCSRPIYAGNTLCTVKYTGEDPCMMSIRSTSFSPTADAMSETKVAPITQVDLSFLNEGKSTWVNLTSQDTEWPDLANARVVVTGGRGLRSSENFKLLEQLAEKLGAAVGATRDAVEAGYVPNDLQGPNKMKSSNNVNHTVSNFEADDISMFTILALHISNCSFTKKPSTNMNIPL
ncbi:Electron transfer flavoprotein subunit alpha, mitochondrial [Zea mays]|uniref:Electron transfer flavoprotein subunit alpha, mitochondrial n=1 Tax=Zea mays TaxID=4577 RepID=A0A317Y4Y7_MAIZE|nr:Electron transfer flavoprotein subunit alpha, mitochondrial [Zea mays]